MKILIYATTFGADLWSLTHYLDQKDEVEIRVLLKSPSTFKAEGIAELFPLDARLVKRKWYHKFVGIPDFEPDITIMDNHVPFRAPSPKGMILWHGFGWKGPNDVKELRLLHFLIKCCWGSAQAPNPDFRWQCFGPWDYKHRTQVSGIHPENCRVLGAASHDYLRKPFSLHRAQPYYPFDIEKRPTVLIAPTWHYGEVLAHWGSDWELFPKLVNHISERGANIILRLHDSFRFDKEYVAFLQQLAESRPNVLLKFKNKNPDNFLDLKVSDVLITNYSSIANLYYATGRPTIHIYPVKNADEQFLWRNQTIAGVWKKRIRSARYIWKLPPEEHGGMMVRDFKELLNKVDIALDNPDCCKQKAEQFLEKYMLGADGNNNERIWNEIQALVYGEKEPARYQYAGA